MKKTFIIAIATLLMGATNTFASNKQKDVVPMDTVRAYFIDGVRIKNFTGAELVGKTVKSYQIIPSTYDNMDGKGACHVLLLHDIKTANAPQKAKDPTVYIVDGVEKTEAEMKKIPTGNIKAVKVFKKGSSSEYAKKYGENTNVLLITTK